MSDEVRVSTEEVTSDKKVDATHKRQRIKRMKIAIIVMVIILFLLPTVLCIILGIHLSKLQGQVDSLLSTYSYKFDDEEQKKISGKYAYASTDELIDKALNNPEVFPTNVLSIISEKLDDSATDDKSNNRADKDNSDDHVDNVEITDYTETVEDTDNADYTETVEDTDVADYTETVEDTDVADYAETAEDIDITDYTDNADNDNIVSTDIFRVPGRNQKLTYNTDYEVNTQDTRDPNGIYYDKKVYLTFDDGPTMHTDHILDILAEYNVKATFFVIGHTDEISKERYRRIVNEGHVLGIHSYSHKYQDIYKSLENFDKDFTKLWNLLYDTTGYTPTLYRFPGGSLGFLSKSKMKEYVRFLDEKGMTYYDWNVVNGDAEGINYTEEQMINNVLNGVARKKTSIVLMHDGEGKHKTVATLPDILDALISGGAEVLPMDETVPLIQQIKASSLK